MFEEMDWNPVCDIDQRYLIDSTLTVNYGDIELVYEIQDWHVPNDSLHEIHSTYYIHVNFRDSVDLITDDMKIFHDHQAKKLDVFVVVVDLEENPYYDMIEWENWLNENYVPTLNFAIERC